MRTIETCFGRKKALFLEMILFFWFPKEIRPCVLLKSFTRVRATVLVVAVDLLLCIKRMIFSCLWLIANSCSDWTESNR